MAKAAKAALRAERLDAVADRGYFNSEEILACEQAGITVTLPKPMTSGAKAEGRKRSHDPEFAAKLEDIRRSLRRSAQACGGALGRREEPCVDGPRLAREKSASGMIRLLAVMCPAC
jgi:hypothetical protein